MKAVELHSHDFEWEDLARVCREQVERSSDDASTCTEDREADAIGDDAQELAAVAKVKWDVFHQKNNGVCVCSCVSISSCLAARRVSSELTLLSVLRLVLYALARMVSQAKCTSHATTWSRSSQSS